MMRRYSTLFVTCFAARSAEGRRGRGNPVAAALVYCRRHAGSVVSGTPR